MPTPHPSPRPGTHRRTGSAGSPQIERTRVGLLTSLDSVGLEGWDGPTGTALLTYIRYELIRPLTIDVGLRGGAAAQAEATAWEAVWLQLCDPHLRAARSPWGVIWQTARRAVLGEILAARWGMAARRAWQHDAAERAGLDTRPVSLEPLLQDGGEPPTQPSVPPGVAASRVSVALDQAADALIEAGWVTRTARQVVAEVAAMEEGLSHGGTVVGWRPLAARLGLPPWQARRLTFVLRGSVERPGLLARLIEEGPSAASGPDVREAPASTLARRHPSPMRRSPELRPPEWCTGGPVIVSS